ncbi:MAG TPA: hypothetical protein VG347_04660 [Verrucomicrobiae bacterium]|nr:hypothetical protein [Verrucomicrobiae bacterium]
MRHLLQPRVLNLASLAAAVSALASYPRMVLWLTRPNALWYLEATIFLCGIILWGFVFAWHPVYVKKPVFDFKWEPKLFTTVTVTGIGMAVVYGLFLDPSLRTKLPDEYPADLEHWLAFLAFALAFNQLFITFAPCDWCMRLFKRTWVAASLTALFGAFVLILNIQAREVPVSSSLMIALLVARITIGFLAVSFYLRGGVVLSWWWTLVLESRHLFHLSDH